MKIALIGYGKMGHMIEQVALLRGHEIVCTIDINEEDKFNTESFRSADVAIEFTTPQTAEQNIRNAWAAGVPVVSGTTGWDAEKLMAEKNTPGLVWKSNFSVGVNIFFDLNKWLAERLKQYPQYHPHIYEEHHVHKLDKPSGTAKTLAEQIVESQEDVQGDNVQGTKGQELKVESIPIESVREGEIPGNHSVIWDSPEDTIVISHMAKGREGFALGAVIAAEKIMNNE